MTDFSVDDLYLHQKVIELHGVAARRSAVGTVRSVDRDSNTYVSCIWEFDTDGRPARQLTRGPGLDSSPRWSPDGKTLAFLSSRGGSVQLYVIEADGAEARRVGSFPSGASSFCWMEDSKALLVAAAVPADPDLHGAGGPAGPRQPEDPEVAWRLPYKADGIGYILDREIHLQLQPLDGDAIRMTEGPFDVLGFAPSPNGRHIAYTRSRAGRFAHCSDLWVCDVDGTRHRRLTHNHSTVLQPAWSPDGRWIAFGGALKEGDGETRLWLMEFATGETVPFGPPGMELALPGEMYWERDSQALVVVRAHRGRHEVVRIGLANGALGSLVAGDRQFSAFAAGETNLFYGVDSPVQASEVWTSRADGSAERQASTLNPWWLNRTPLLLESRQFEVPDGLGGMETIEGWLLRAKGPSPGPRPLLNDAHGGPAAYALLDFDTNVFWQVLCSRGWAVLMLNAVGSSSFGSEFCCRLSGHWGEYDLPQHRAAISQLQAAGIADKRVAIAGKSYGGYLASWAVGHCDDFRAAVVMAPVGNIETHYGTSDGGYYADPLYIGTAPAFDRARARELSPLQSIEKSVTPTLFMQGKDDERCPKCQSEELFVSMCRAQDDVPAELVLYPGEDHHFLGEGKPKCRSDAARRIVDWVTTHAGRAGQVDKRESDSENNADLASREEVAG